MNIIFVFMAIADKDVFYKFQNQKGGHIGPPSLIATYCSLINTH